MLPRFATKFGIWEDEVQELIQNISTQTNIPKDQLSDWFYSQGLLSFMEASKSSFLSGILDAAIPNIDSMKKINYDFSMDKKLSEVAAGFSAVREKFIESFANDNVAMQAVLIKLFDEMQAKANANHLGFYVIEANLENECARFQGNLRSQKKDIAPSAERELILSKEMELFQEMQVKISKEIDTHIQFKKMLLKTMEQHPEIMRSHILEFTRKLMEPVLREQMRRDMETKLKITLDEIMKDVEKEMASSRAAASKGQITVSTPKANTPRAAVSMFQPLSEIVVDAASSRFKDAQDGHSENIPRNV